MVEYHLPLRSAIGRSESEEVKGPVSTVGSGGRLGSGTWSTIVSTGLAESEVGATVFERLIYTCYGLGIVSFFGYS